MQHYWQESITPEVNLPPWYLFELEDYRKQLRDLEDKIGSSIDDEELLSRLFSCLLAEASAEIEIEYLYLELVSKYVYGQLYFEFEEVLDFMLALGGKIFNDLQFHKVYQDGLLPYAYCRREADSVVLHRRDLFHTSINLELSDGITGGACARYSGYTRDCG